MLVELLAYAIIVGLLATLVYCTRPHTFGAQVESPSPNPSLLPLTRHPPLAR